MNNQEYKEYRESPEWKQRAKYEIDRVHGACVLCGEREHLLVHHLNYLKTRTEAPGIEPYEYLLVVCPKCHAILHSSEAACQYRMETAVRRFASDWEDLKAHEKEMENSLKELYASSVSNVVADYTRMVMRGIDKYKLKYDCHEENGFHSQALTKVPVQYAKKFFPEIDEDVVRKKVEKIYKEENAKKR